MKQINVAILGYGGIARQHLAAIGLLASRGYPIKCVAVCDRDPRQFEGNLKMNLDNSGASLDGVHLYTDLDEMLAGEDISFVEICLPSFLNKEYATLLLSRGYHVLCEKPMAMNEEECDAILAARDASGCELLVGQCLRFEAAYLTLKELIDGGKYGAVRTAHFDRLSEPAVWGSKGWYQKTGSTGGSLMEVGIHDYDMARFLFGDPAIVSAVSLGGDALHAWANARLVYADGRIVTANCGWIDSPSFGFEAKAHITLEGATVVLDAQAKIHVYPVEGEKYELPYESVSYMAEEILYFAEVVDGRHANERASGESAKRTVALVKTLCKSAEVGGVPLCF